MDSIDSWAIAGGVAGVIGALLSGVTLFFVVRADRRERRNTPYAELLVHSFGILRDEGTGAVLCHIWQLTNSGSADVRIQNILGVGCDFLNDEQYPPVTVVRAGEFARIRVESSNYEAAWVLVNWTSPNDRDGWYVAWFAPSAGTELAAVRDAQPSPRRKWWWSLLPFFLVVRIRKVEPVGPGGVRATRVHRGLRRAERDIQTALALALPADEDGESIAVMRTA